MHRLRSMIHSIEHFIHQNYLCLMVGAYVVAALLPGPGLQLRQASLGALSVLGQQVRISLGMLMLSFLLLNAGLGVDLRELKKIARMPLTLAAGLTANVFIPIAYIFGAALVLTQWHDVDEVQNILVGLALVAAMPIAGSSAAWSQNANGNMALSLGLVIFSTLLAPITTPFGLNAVSLMTTGEYAKGLHDLAGGATNAFLFVSVILPSLIGMVLRMVVGNDGLNRVKPYLKLSNFAVLLILIYSNASVSLPQALSQPDYDFLAVMLLIVAGLCSVAFLSGWALSRILQVGSADRASLMFGLGMNNNGTGLVLASLALSDYPGAMLPIILYNLVQHLIAGVVDKTVLQKEIQQFGSSRIEPATA